MSQGEGGGVWVTQNPATQATQATQAVTSHEKMGSRTVRPPPIGSTRPPKNPLPKFFIFFSLDFFSFGFFSSHACPNRHTDHDNFLVAIVTVVVASTGCFIALLVALLA